METDANYSELNVFSIKVIASAFMNLHRFLQRTLRRTDVIEVII